MRVSPVQVALAIILAASAGTVFADPPPPPLALSARETVDLWDDASGGVRTGSVLLSKLQVSGTATEPFGLSGFSVHVQLFRTDGQSLSDHVGDIQTVSNIEAVPANRLFESWIEKKFGDDQRSFAIRAGLIDLNSDFDSISAASLFINSSHGIGADLARSGENGPSIFPVSSPAVRLSWLPSKRWTFRTAIFDGVPGDPDRPKAFVSARLRQQDGALLIGQADWHLSDTAKVEAGSWAYTAKRAPLPGLPPRHDAGFYASIEAPLPGQKVWSAWLRAGEAERGAQIVRSYLGAGLVGQGVWGSRPDDRVGVAIARAAIDRESRDLLSLRSNETTFEASYQYKIHKTLAVQPDVQYVHHPDGIAYARNALVGGLRLILTAGYPRQAPATDATDPTVAPDGPQPTDEPK